MKYTALWFSPFLFRRWYCWLRFLNISLFCMLTLACHLVFVDILVSYLPCQYEWMDIVLDYVWGFFVVFLWFWLVLWLDLFWPILRPHLPVAFSCLLVQVSKLLKASLANVISYWPFLGSSMKPTRPKKWLRSLKANLRMWLILGLSWPEREVACPKSGTKTWRPTCEYGLPLGFLWPKMETCMPKKNDIKIWRSACKYDLSLGLFMGWNKNACTQKVVWKFEDLLAIVVYC